MFCEIIGRRRMKGSEGKGGGGKGGIHGRYVLHTYRGTYQYTKIVQRQGNK